MRKLFLGVVLVLAGVSSAAHATTVDVLLGATSNNQTYSISALPNNANINLSTLSAGTLDYNNAQIVNPAASVTNQYLKPTGAIFGNNYLAVFGSPFPGTATLHIAAADNQFGFTWGSIDPYNYLILTDTRHVVYVITGAELLSHIVGSVSGTTQTDIQFNDPFGAIVSAQFLSTANSFEVANFYQGQSSVPLPASMGLFMTALAGLFLLRRKQVA